MYLTEKCNAEIWKELESTTETSYGPQIYVFLLLSSIIDVF